MRAAVWHGPKDVRVEEVPEPPPPGPDEVTLDVELCGICGTDLHEYDSGPHVIPFGFDHPLTGARAPQILGHEMAGLVSAVGDRVQDVTPGTRCAVQPLVSCGVCDPCLHGHRHLCERQGCVGLSHAWGGFASKANIPANQLVPLPDSIAWEQAALIEPAAVALYAVEGSRLRAGSSILITGAGPIGLLCALAAAALGASTIMQTDLSVHRRELAKELGSGALVYDPLETDVGNKARELSGQDGFNCAVECSGSVAGLRDCLRAVGPGGGVSQAALFVGRAEFDAFDLVRKNIHYTGCWCYRTTDLLRVSRMIGAGRFPVEKVVTRTISLDSIVDNGFGALDRADSGEGKILVRPR